MEPPKCNMASKQAVKQELGLGWAGGVWGVGFIGL
jgi:hypothetical protein